MIKPHLKSDKVTFIGKKATFFRIFWAVYLDNNTKLRHEMDSYGKI